MLSKDHRAWGGLPSELTARSSTPIRGDARLRTALPCVIAVRGAVNAAGLSEGGLLQVSPNIAVVTGPIATGDTARSPSSRSCSARTPSTAKEAHGMPSATSPLRVIRTDFGLRVNVGQSMETVSQPQASRSKSLKDKDPVSGVPKSLGQRALRKIRSLEEISVFWPTTRSTTPAAIQRRHWAIPARRQDKRIVGNWEAGGPKATYGKRKARRILTKPHGREGSPSRVGHAPTCSPPAEMNSRSTVLKNDARPARINDLRMLPLTRPAVADSALTCTQFKLVQSIDCRPAGFCCS
jgi:hypothetical protein